METRQAEAFRREYCSPETEIIRLRGGGDIIRTSGEPSPTDDHYGLWEDTLD